MRLDCLFVYTNLGPHMAAWINASACHHRCGVVELAGKQAIYDWEAAHLDASVFHDVLAPGSEVDSIDIGESAKKANDIINDLRPRAVLTCRYDLPVIRKITRSARRSGAVTLLMSDSWEGAKQRNPVREVIKGALLRRLYDGGITAGHRSWSYLRKLGFRDEALWTGIDVVDNRHFRPKPDEPQSAAGHAPTPEIPPEYFLVPCRHVPEKNLPRLIQAFSAYRKEGGSWSAVLVGSGPLSLSLAALAKKLDVESAVVFAGHVRYADLPAYYNRSGAVILPSISETWGFVVNEAMAAEKPVLVSTRCGCVPELVRRGVNGYTFDPLDTRGLTSRLHWMSSPDCDRASLGKNGANMIQAFTPETRALAIRDCVETMTGTRGKTS